MYHVHFQGAVHNDALVTSVVKLCNYAQRLRGQCFDGGLGLCRQMATQGASAEIACYHRDFADAGRRREDEGGEGAGGFWFSAVLGSKGLKSPHSALTRYCIP